MQPDHLGDKKILALENTKRKPDWFSPQSGFKDFILKDKFRGCSDPFCENSEQNNDADWHTEYPKTKCTHVVSPSQIEFVTCNNEVNHDWLHYCPANYAAINFTAHAVISVQRLAGSDVCVCELNPATP